MRAWLISSPPASISIGPSTRWPVVGGLLDERGLVAVGPRADVVGDVHRLIRGRAHLVDDQPFAGLGGARTAAGRRSKIGEERPLGGESVEVIDVVSVECGVLAGEFGEGGHHP